MHPPQKRTVPQQRQKINKRRRKNREYVSGSSLSPPLVVPLQNCVFACFQGYAAKGAVERDAPATEAEGTATEEEHKECVLLAIAACFRCSVVQLCLCMMLGVNGRRSCNKGRN